MTGQFGGQNVEHHGRVAAFVGKARPVKIAGFPGFAEKPARVSSKERKWLRIEQSARVTLRHGRVRHAKFLRQVFRTGILRISAGEALQFPACLSPEWGLFRKPAGELGGQKKSFGGKLLGNPPAGA